MEQRSLEELELNKQAELSLNVRPRLSLVDNICMLLVMFLFRWLYDRITEIRRSCYLNVKMTDLRQWQISLDA